MKKAFLFLLVSFSVLSCSMQKHSSLDESAKAAIATTISASLDSILAGWNSNNLEMMFPALLKSEEFTYMGIDGKMYNYDEFLEMVNSQFSFQEYAKYTLKDKKVKVIDANTAVGLVRIAGEIRIRNGNVQKYENVGISFVFEKHDGLWWVTHFQESTLPGVQANF